ncbi:MAG: UvrD-helicase domain-containing protein [Chloroflexi bacterium]|nr:UvrD-helicase domain-containing protein [Chloroflexota bacterium]
MTLDLLAGLNAAQQKAVEALEGPILILAGPGSGKTRVITHRIAYLVRVWNVGPRRIMAVTFTNKAAAEMKERLSRMLGKMVEQLTVGTFHACCARFLRIDGPAIGIDRNFVIYDDDDQLRLVKKAIEELGLDPQKVTPRAVISGISAAKSQLLTPEACARQGHSYFDEIVKRVYERYQEMLANSHALDFDDLLMTTVRLFQQKPEILEKYQNRYLHLLVDEFQDTNIAQYVLAKQLSGKHKNICVVGDPDQSIYSWRHADIRNILNFEKDFPQAQVFYLEQNYRSTGTILEAATSIISHNQQRKPKELWTQNEKGSPIVVAEVADEWEEASQVVNEIDKLTRTKEVKLRDCAVMYRTNAQSRVLEETFMRYGTPYKLVGGTRFYERKEIKDIIAYLRLLHNPFDSVSLARIVNVPGRGIGHQSFNQFTAWAGQQGLSHYAALQRLAELNQQGAKSSLPVTSRAVAAFQKFFELLEGLIEVSRKSSVMELLGEVVARTGYKGYLFAEDDGEDRWENIQELQSSARDYEVLPPGEALGAFLEKVALVQDVDELDEKSDAVTLITLHKAKGLEYSVVFIIGLEEKLFPHIRSYEDPAQLEEERRLCYVGVTRAKKRLYLFHANQRILMGMRSSGEPSRFLDDIPAKLIAGDGQGGKPAAGRQEHKAALSSWKSEAPKTLLISVKAGDSVIHKVFGEGVVISCQPVTNDFEALVNFKGAGLKKLLLSLAPLKKLDNP